MSLNNNPSFTIDLAVIACYKVLSHYHELRSIIDRYNNRSASADDMFSLIDFVVDVERITYKALLPNEYGYALHKFFLDTPEDESRTAFDRTIRYKLGRAYKKYGLYPIQKYFHQR